MNHFIAAAVVTLARVVPRLHVDWVDLLQMVPQAFDEPIEQHNYFLLKCDV